MKEDFSAESGFSINTEIAEKPENLEEKPREKTSALSFLVEWLEVLVTAIIAVVVVFTLIFRVATIDGSSMNTTLLENQMVVISNFNYTPKYKDIVVISRNVENSLETQSTSKGPIIKRVIAVGGQTVNIDFETGTVYVDNEPLKEDYISTPTHARGDVNFPLYVPEGYIFVMGDNRMISLDSRSSSIGEGGLVDTRYVLGRAVFRIFPFDKVGRLDNK